MACDFFFTYEVYEVDEHGSWLLQEKRVSLNPRQASVDVVLSFFNQMVKGINTVGGHMIYYEGHRSTYDLAFIKWHKPLWKLIRVK